MALIIVVVADVIIVPALVRNRATASPASSATAAAVLPIASATVLSTLVPTLTPSAPLPPTASPVLVTPTPIPLPSATPTAPPTPAPTAAPTATPQLSTIKVRIEDDAFVGDYNGVGSGTYHGRTATWVYGQGTPYSTMTAQFQLEQTGAATGSASIKIIGLEGSNPEKERIRIVLNGSTIYQGADPLPNDFGSGPSGPGNWGSATFKFSADLLARNNELSITNLTQSSCTLCPDFVLVDYVVVQYTVAVGG